MEKKQEQLSEIKTFHEIAVTCAILNSSGKNPSLNMSLNKELKGKDIGVAIRDKKNFHGTAQLD